MTIDLGRVSEETKGFTPAFDLEPEIMPDTRF